MGREIGFYANLSSGSEKLKKNPEDCLIRFDSGNGITFEDARHHILVMGTTGSGKTADVILPVLERMMAKGHSGVIVDVKGNMSSQTRTFAKHCGRSADIVEFGSSPTATPVNILNNMNINDARCFLETLTNGCVSHADHNKYWHLKGVHQAGDCVQLLRYLMKFNAIFEPSISMISALINNFHLSNQLYDLYKKEVYDKEDVEQYTFVKRFESDAFHIFNPPPENDNDRAELERMHQLTWHMQAIRMALKDFMDGPGIRRGFATKGAGGIDLRGLLEQNKIVLLRFAPDTGPIGASLARIILEEYYKAVYATGLNMPEGRYTFACLDEFQAFADLSNARYSDTNFAAQAREFHAIFVASTQSMSAIANQGNSLAAVEALVSNCNARVLFYSDDIATQAMAGRYGNIRLNELKSGEAFVVQYDTEERSHSYGVETLHDAYKMTQEILRQSGYSVDKNYGISAETEVADEMTLLNKFLKELKEKEQKENKPKKRVVEKSSLSSLGNKPHPPSKLFLLDDEESEIEA